MPDSYGSSQDANVLSYQDCSWDTAFFLKGRPVQTTEISLLGQISSYNDMQSTKSMQASGFLDVGGIRDTANISDALSSALSGEVFTTPETLGAFYLASRKAGNWAIVNGWPVNVSSNLVSEDTYHNLIQLPTNSDTTVNLVFLEVWRSVVDYQDVIKKFGNQETTLSIPNDLYQGSLGIETSRRVQIQYRIRVIDKDTSIHAYPDGFSSAIKARGASGADTTLTYTSMASEGDSGLYRAGRGNDADKAALGTVDGYCYAVPMFLVSRRTYDAQDIFDPKDMNSWFLSKNKEGENSFRPDGKFADVIYSTDIIDLRKKVAFEGTLPATLKKTFAGITTGTASTTKGRLTDRTGGLTDVASGGSILIKTDKVSAPDGGSDPVGMLATVASGVPRRTFLSGKNNQVRSIQSLTWVGSVATIPLAGYQGSSFAIDPLFTVLFNQFGVVFTTGFTVAIENDSAIKVTWISGAAPLSAFLKFDLSWATPGTEGFTDVAEEILEQRFVKGLTTEHILATTANNVQMYGRDTFYSSTLDRVECLVTSERDLSSFGQVAVIHRAAEVTYPGIFHIQLGAGATLLGGTTSGKSAAKVLGLRSARRKLVSGGYASSYLANVLFDLDTNNNVLIVDTSSSPVQAGETSDVELTLYLGSKFSSLDEESNGIKETYETSYCSVQRQGVTTNYAFDTTPLGSLGNQKAIVGVCSVLSGSVDTPTVTPYVLIESTTSGYWEMNTVSGLSNILKYYPYEKAESSLRAGMTSCTPVRMQWNNGTLLGNTAVKIAVHTHSWLEADEKQYITYNTRGYQGLKLSGAPLMGDILEEGEAIITTKGSGASSEESLYFSGASIEAYSGNVWKVSFADHRVYSNGQISSGDYIRFGDYTGREDNWKTSLFKVSSVASGTNLQAAPCTVITFVNTLSLPSAPSTSIEGWFIKAGMHKDGFHSVVSRMPGSTMDSYLYNGLSLTSLSSFNFGDSTVWAKPVSSGKSWTFARKNGVSVGTGSDTRRGSFDLTIELPDGTSLAEHKMTEVFTRYPGAIQNPDVPYKVFQPYLFRESSSGKIYVVVVSSSYSSKTLDAKVSPYRGVDTVDVFETVGHLVSRGDL
jgi:hypothetical protein